MNFKRLLLLAAAILSFSMVAAQSRPAAAAGATISFSNFRCSYSAFSGLADISIDPPGLYHYQYTVTNLNTSATFVGRTVSSVFGRIRFGTATVSGNSGDVIKMTLSATNSADPSITGSADAYPCGGGPSAGSSAEGAFVGPAIPRNKDGSLYEQKYIACTMSVFDAPGGNAVKGESVKEGQVFYAGKDTEEDAEGRSWTPIFVSSVPVVWIWSSCVK